MKEQRSFSVGSLPVNLRSHILKTSQYSNLHKIEASSAQDGLNPISELPDDFEKPLDSNINK
jgi:hypothetical protein